MHLLAQNSLKFIKNSHNLISKGAFRNSGRSSISANDNLFVQTYSNFQLLRSWKQTLVLNVIKPFLQILQLQKVQSDELVAVCGGWKLTKLEKSLNSAFLYVMMAQITFKILKGFPSIN